jgi:hypothetical protein
MADGESLLSNDSTDVLPDSPFLEVPVVALVEVGVVALEPLVLLDHMVEAPILAKASTT